MLDLSGALDAVSEPVLTDPVHTNDAGARTVAEALYRRLAPVLAALADS